MQTMPRRDFGLEHDHAAIHGSDKKRKTESDNAQLPGVSTDLKSLAPKYYTVGCICAITTEYVAVQAFLDEKHNRPEHIPSGDNNEYTLGKIGHHNVVIAALPDRQYGIVPAASVATDMLHSFPNIRIGLMVGIGGGAPSPRHDIRLGDVVVGVPTDGLGHVFQYDFGKTVQNQACRSAGQFSPSPLALLSAVSGLEADYEEDGNKLGAAINSAIRRDPRLQNEYSRPSQCTDRLYRSEVTHPLDNDSSCSVVCSQSPLHLVERRSRIKDKDDDPAVHYGTIASADRLIQNAVLRDKLTKEKDILCFEMGAAGVMIQFPCLLIRGICDYSDSHRNKEWQGYAAMVAAAYAKDLLCRIRRYKVDA